jgi:predicted ABC-type ATPase
MSIPRWQAAGYRVGLIFLELAFVEIAISRVAQRAQRGGHSVPEEVIRRRFVAGRANFDRIYRSIVDEWWHFDSSDLPGVLIARGGFE